MQPLKKYTVIGTIIVLLAGTLSHFLYEWSGNHPLVGLFTPVNESVWEHMKLIFFPMLLYGLFLIFRFQDSFPCTAPSLCLGLLAGTLLIPVLFYTYTGILGKDVFLLDLGTFLISVLAAFRLFYRQTLSCKVKPYAVFLYLPVCLLLVCFMIFTRRPPELPVFQAYLTLFLP